MVSTLAQTVRDVGSIPAQGTIFPIFITPATSVCIYVTHNVLCQYRQIQKGFFTIFLHSLRHNTGLSPPLNVDQCQSHWMILYVCACVYIYICI